MSGATSPTTSSTGSTRPAARRHAGHARPSRASTACAPTSARACRRRLGIHHQQSPQPEVELRVHERVARRRRGHLPLQPALRHPQREHRLPAQAAATPATTASIFEDRRKCLRPGPRAAEHHLARRGELRRSVPGARPLRRLQRDRRRAHDLLRTGTWHRPHSSASTSTR